MTAATRGKATLSELEAGYTATVAGKLAREAKHAAGAAGRAWASCLKNIFEVDPVRCAKCGGEMKLAAVILDDKELDRILAHQGWPVAFPKTKAPRAPPGNGAESEEGGQADGRSERWDGRQDFPSEWPA